MTSPPSEMARAVPMFGGRCLSCGLTAEACENTDPDGVCCPECLHPSENPAASTEDVAAVSPKIEPWAGTVTVRINDETVGSVPLPEHSEACTPELRAQDQYAGDCERCQLLMRREITLAKYPPRYVVGLPATPDGDLDKLLEVDPARLWLIPDGRRLDLEEACRVLHDAYEEAAAAHGWQTQARSRVPWEEVPEANQATMRDAVGALLRVLGVLPGFPRESGDVIVIGPECFADQARTVVCWQGVNFYRARRLALAPLGLTPEGHVDDVGCWCGPATDGSSGLLHTLTQDEPTGAALIAAERRRQVEDEGYSLEHDREHGAGKLYHAGWALELDNRGLWPRGWAWKPKNALRDLIRAGALYQASADVASEDWIRDRATGARDQVARMIDDLLAEARRVTLGGRS